MGDHNRGQIITRGQTEKTKARWWVLQACTPWAMPPASSTNLQNNALLLLLLHVEPLLLPSCLESRLIPQASLPEAMDPAFGWVILVVVLYCCINAWMMIQVVKARKRYNVPFPILYAVESENNNAKLFNCVQRGHQNSIEFMPVFFILVTLAGLQFPKVAASLGLLYCISRFLYFKGYSTGEPENRLNYGKYNFAALLGLFCCSAVAGMRLLSQ